MPLPLSVPTKLCALILSLIVAPALAGTTLERVREQQFVNCGIHSSLPGFAIQTETGWQGLEVDFCRAVAAAALGDANRVRFLPLATEAGYTALQSGRIDLLVRHHPWSLAQDTTLGLTFVAPLFYEAQGFLVAADSNIYVAADIEGQNVCHGGEADIGAHLATFSRRENLRLEIRAMASFATAAKAFENGLCAALAGDLAQLYIAKAQLADRKATQVVAEFIEVRALGPLVRADDHEWFKAVRWTLYLMLSADQFAAGTGQPLELAGVRGIGIGLSADWPKAVLDQVGSYGAVFERHLGSGSDYGMPRGLNRLAREGGLQVLPLLD